MLSLEPGDAGYLSELAEFVAVPSVSRDADRRHHERGRALAGRASSRSPAAGSSPTDGHPVVRADWLGAPGAPTVLVYGHYDVQPTGDLAEWVTPPVRAAGTRRRRARGRGVSDDKGPVYIVLKTAQAFAAQEGGLPLNVKFLLEGEEEIGSPHLPGYLREHAAELACRPGHLRRRRDVAARRAVPVRWPPRAWSPWTSPSRAPAPTCTRAATAAPWPTRCTRWPRSWPACTPPTAASPSPGFYDGIPALTDERRAEIADGPF